jgi:Uma2 family endonuclease
MGIVERLVAEGVTRRKFTGEEVLAMCDAGILGEPCHVEVIDGEMIEMAPEGTQHDISRNLLLENALERAILTYGSQRPFVLLSTPTVWLSDSGFVEPDIAIVPAVEKGKRFLISELLLVIEISLTSLSYDLGSKSQLYATEKVPEYWVIDLKRGELVRHTQPTQAGYASIKRVTATGIMAAETFPAFNINIDHIL